MNLSLKQQLSLIAGSASIAIVALSVMGFVALHNLSIGGAMHKEMLGSQEVMIEIAPPSLYLLETTMQTYGLGNLQPNEITVQVKKIQKSINSFKAKIDDWESKSFISAEQRSLIGKDIKTQAFEMLDFIESDVITAAQAGDMARVGIANHKVQEYFTEHSRLVSELYDITDNKILEVENKAADKVNLYNLTFLIVAVVSIVIVLFLGIYISMKILSDLGMGVDELKRISFSLAGGDFAVEKPEVKDYFSVLGAVSIMIERVEETVTAANNNFRTTQALTCSSACVMVADEHRNIVYMNKSVEKMLRALEFELRAELPQFSVDKVIGSSMDIFHKNPAHQSRILEGLKETYTANIKIGNLSFRLIADPIFDEFSRRVGTAIEWQDRTKEVAAEHEMSRLLGALEATTTNVMIANPDRTIIYMNKSVEAMLRIAEADIRSVLPHFSVDKVRGSNMDKFHKNPSHQMKLLENLTTAYTANIVVGKRHFRLVANPIFSKNGDRLGSVVEWLDRTQEIGVEGEVSKLVECAASGDFSERISVDGKDGFFLKLAEGLNMLVNTADQGLNDVARVLGAVAKGDLTERIDAEYQGTFGKLKNYCNQTTDNLTEMLSDIRTAADTIFTASSEIAQGNADLSSRTEQQAANLEETASSMEELTSTVKLNADNAKQANVLAEQASTVASNGGSLIQQVVTTMSEINQSSQKISDIIGVIDGIAFQTNILALNAAVEAARAGDQGRGFAVVASEVRTLAQRSANAAKDIKGLISDSVQKIESGNALVNKSGDTMKEIVTAIKRVNDIMAEIAAASAEQSTGIEEVSTAVSQMDEMTQQNAALVEQAAAAAESMQSQADQLNHSVSQFILSTEIEKHSSKAPRLSSHKPQ
jgi:methyl-accepting chemotaxis protein